jgi:hypothetical protein
VALNQQTMECDCIIIFYFFFQNTNESVPFSTNNSFIFVIVVGLLLSLSKQDLQFNGGWPGWVIHLQVSQLLGPWQN